MSIVGAGSKSEGPRNVLLQSIVQAATGYEAGLEKYYAV